MSATITLDRETVAFIAATHDVSPEQFLERIRLRANWSRPAGDTYNVVVEGTEHWCHAITQQGTHCSLWAPAHEGYSLENSYCTRHREIFTRDASLWLTKNARPAEVDRFVGDYLRDAKYGGEVAGVVDSIVAERIKTVWGAA